MATALYRRYRPENFAEMIGQSQVTDPLMTALRTGRVNHAYLFSGPRGCGKTSSARILARCLNCAEGPTDTPCGVCQSCVELARDGGGSLDVFEIDAASHGGVEDARELRERAILAPSRDRYKIFIIDEAHMVTSAGFNALLKVVEEPPEHVRFVFATTEPEKVIGTIRSRTHHYPFRLIPPALMLEYVEGLCTSEGVTAEPGVLPLVVRAGGGSARDTLSLLDQIIAGSETGLLGYQRAAALLGFTGQELLDESIDAFADADPAAAYTAVDRVIQSGQDPRRYIEDLLERLRDLIVAKATGPGAGAVLRGLGADEVEALRVQAGRFSPAALTGIADLVNETLSEMSGVTSPKLHLELLVARILVASRAEFAEAGQLLPVADAPGTAPRALPESATLDVPSERPAPTAVREQSATRATPDESREPAPQPQRPEGRSASGTTPVVAAPNRTEPGSTSERARGEVPVRDATAGTPPAPKDSATQASASQDPAAHDSASVARRAAASWAAAAPASPAATASSSVASSARFEVDNVALADTTAHADTAARPQPSEHPTERAGDDAPELDDAPAAAAAPVDANETFAKDAGTANEAIEAAETGAVAPVEPSSGASAPAPGSEPTPAERGAPAGAPDPHATVARASDEPVVFAQLRDAWPTLLERMRDLGGQHAWNVAQSVHPRDLDGELLVFEVPSRAILDQFRGERGAADAPSAVLRTAIQEMFGITVKFQPQRPGGAAASAEQALAARSSAPSQAERSPVSPTGHTPSPGHTPNSGHNPRPSGGEASGKSTTGGAAPVSRPEATAEAASTGGLNWTVAKIPGQEAQPDDGPGSGWATAAIPSTSGAAPDVEASAPAVGAQSRAPESSPAESPRGSSESQPTRDASQPGAKSLSDAASAAAPGVVAESPASASRTVSASAPPELPHAAPVVLPVQEPVATSAPQAEATQPRPQRVASAPVVPGVERYGEAIVRERLGARFIGEEVIVAEPEVVELPPEDEYGAPPPPEDGGY